MIFKFGQYKVDINIEKTRYFYNNAQLVSDGCTCDGCENFEKAVSLLPKTVTAFFAALGIDMRKICESYVNCVNNDETLLYGGFYHVCGTVSGGSDSCAPAASDGEDDLTFPVSDDMHISFRESCDLLEKGFPLPVIQLEISANIPWVLEKENPYI